MQAPVSAHLTFLSKMWYIISYQNKTIKNLQHLDILASISANKQSFQNPTKWFFIGFRKDGLLTELQAKMSKGCRYLLFRHHNYYLIMRYQNNSAIFIELIVVKTPSVRYKSWA